MAQVAESRPADASSALDRVHHWIGGRRVAGTSGRHGPVYNPATGKVAREVDFASRRGGRCRGRRRARRFPAWRATSLCKRTEIMFRIRNLVDEHRKDIAAFLTAEHGKVPSDAQGEVARGLENLEFARGIPQLLKGT